MHLKKGFLTVLNTLFLISFCVQSVSTETPPVALKRPLSPYGLLNRLFVKGEYAYVAEYDSGLKIFYVNPDTLNPDSIELVGSHPNLPGCNNTTMHDIDVFINDEQEAIVTAQGLGMGTCSSVQKYDISNPDSITLIAIDTLVGFFWPFTDLYADGEHAYSSADYKGLSLHDVSDTLLFKKNIGHGSPQGVHARGKYVYCAAEALTFYIYDKTADVFYEFRLGSNSWDIFNSAYDLLSNNTDTVSVAYIVTGGPNGQLLIYDVTNPEDTSIISCVTVPYSERVRVNGNYCYVAIPRDSIIKVFDVSTIESPNLQTTYSSVARLQDFHVVVDSTGYHHLYAVSYDTFEHTLCYDIFKSTYRDSLLRFGDVDNDGDIDLVDLVKLSNYTAKGYNYPILLNACDVNCDGEINLDDADYLVNYLFRSGALPGDSCRFYYSQQWE